MPKSANKKVAKSSSTASTGDQETQEKTQLTLVQMRLQSRTIDRLVELSKLLGIENRTQIIGAAIHLAFVVITAIVKDGSKVYIEKKNGEKENLTLLV